jgi:hypothetical protein
VLELWRLGRAFDTVIDSGLFHALSDPDRILVVRSLSAALRTDGTYLMLCFSDREPGNWGPQRVTQAKIRNASREGRTILSIRAARFENTLRPVGAWAWFSSIRKG